MLSNRSPLHSKALIASELTVDREIVQFNIHSGVIGRFRVVGRPSNGRIALRPLGGGAPVEHSLGDMGAVPYGGSTWNPGNFCVDLRDVSSLPTDLVPEPPSRVSRYERWGDES